MREHLRLDELRKFGWKKIERLQNKRLEATSKHLLLHAPFYKEFFALHKVDPSKIASPEDWKKLGLPLIKKKLYIERTKDFIVRPLGSNNRIFFVYQKFVSSLNSIEGLKLLIGAFLSRIFPPLNNSIKKEVRHFFRPKMPAFAGGSESGHPTPVLLTAKQKSQGLMNTADISAYLIITRHFGEDDATTGMNLFPYAPHIAWQVINLAAELRCDLNLSTAAGGFLGTDKLIAIAKSSKPNVYSGMADFLINIFLPKMHEEGVVLDDNVVFLNGATKMLEIQRREIKKLFEALGAKNVTALDGYGASELKEATLAECEEGSGFHHIAPLSTIIRIVKIGRADRNSDYIYDWDFAKDDEGGYAVLWNIDGAGTLLEGFILGDHYEKVTTDKCPHCGLNVQRVYNINRIADIETEMKLMGIDEENVCGTIVNLSALREQLLHIDGVREIRLVCERGLSGDKLIVQYVPKPHCVEDLESRIKEVFKKLVDVHPHSIERADISHFYDERKMKFNGIHQKTAQGR